MHASIHTQVRLEWAFFDETPTPCLSPSIHNPTPAKVRAEWVFRSLEAGGWLEESTYEATDLGSVSII